MASRRQSRDIESSLNISISNDHAPLHESQKGIDPDETVRWGFGMSTEDMRKQTNGTSNRDPLVAGVTEVAPANVRHVRSRPVFVNIDRLP